MLIPQIRRSINVKRMADVISIRDGGRRKATQRNSNVYESAHSFAFFALFFSFFFFRLIRFARRLRPETHKYIYLLREQNVLFSLVSVGRNGTLFCGFLGISVVIHKLISVEFYLTLG